MTDDEMIEVMGQAVRAKFEAAETVVGVPELMTAVLDALREAGMVLVPLPCHWLASRAGADPVLMLRYADDEAGRQKARAAVRATLNATSAEGGDG